MSSDRRTMPRTTVSRESPTRRAIRAMVAADMPPREMALALGVSVQAVRKHLKAIRLEAGS